MNNTEKMIQEIDKLRYPQKLYNPPVLQQHEDYWNNGLSAIIEIIRKHSEPKPTSILRHALIEAIGNREGWAGDVSGLVDDLMIIIEGVS